MPDHERKDDMLLENHVKEEMERYAEIEHRLGKIEQQMGDMLEIWVQAKGVFSFIKIVAGIGAGAAAIWAFIHDNFSVALK